MIPFPKSALAISALVTVVAGGVRAIAAGADPPGKNLRVIPRSATPEDVEIAMERMNRDLGVNCTYCHGSTPPGVLPRRADFVGDDKVEKKIARKMMIMTDRLNRKYFGFENDYSVKSAAQSPVSCGTCHRGLPRPKDFKLFNRQPAR